MSKKTMGFVPVGWIKKGLVYQLNPTCADCGKRWQDGYCPLKDCYVGDGCPACAQMIPKYRRRRRQ